MALHPNDLFVIQSQDDSELYKLKLSDLDKYIEDSTGIQFRGSVELTNAANAQNPPVDLNAVANGDLYLVESDTSTINSDWIMEGGAGVGTAQENDRIIWDADSGYWVLVSGGGSTGGTLTGITATTPLQSDNDPVNPVLTIDEASTTEPGAVARLATVDDVKHTDGTGATDAVVTANLLKATNDIVEGLATSAGGVQTVTTTDANGNSALTISPTSGNVVVEIETAEDDGSAYGVVQLANASDITNGTAGATAVVTAAQLKDAIDNLPQEALQSLTEDGDPGVVTGALRITTDADKNVTIGVIEKVFAPYDFSSLTDITD